MTSSSSGSAPDAIHRALSDIVVAGDHQYAWENARRFSGYAKRLQLLVNQLLRSSSSPENLPAPVQTALKGIDSDLAAVSESVSVYKNKSKIFVLIKCRELCASLQERTVAIGAWLALLESSVGNDDDDFSDLHKKIADLSTDMKQARFKVAEYEERVCCALQKEGQGRTSSKAVQSAIVMDLARALGIDCNNYLALSEQVKLLRNDVGSSTNLSERRILSSLERMVDYWAAEPDILTEKWEFDYEEEGAQITPFKNFLCPLTKEVMKDPVVVLESSQTYERTAINYWFERCLEDGREPTCPVSGMVLKTLELMPNIGLAGAIDEWVNRKIDVEIKRAVGCLSSEDSAPVAAIERVLDSMYRISEEHPMSRYKVRNAGIVVLILKLLRDSSSKVIQSLLRGKALMVLLSMAKDDESRMSMLEEGVARLAIRGLIGSAEKERECAVRLLLDLSSDENFCIQIASAKGALVLLSSMADNLENPHLSNLADEVLKRLERIENNIERLAVAGRFEPLLKRLREGPDDVKIEMASIVGRMTLTNTSKEKIASQGAKIFVEMLSKADGIEASLQALRNLSCFEDNATILIDSGALPALTSILFENQVVSTELKELAAFIVANIVTNPGQWELASADKAGQSLQSEPIISSFVGLLSHASPQCQLAILQILYRIASSPQASESVSAHIRSGDAVTTVITFLKHLEDEHRISAFKLTRILSARLGEELATALRSSHMLLMLKNKILDNQSTESERSDAACILANLSLSANEVKTMIGTRSFIEWTVSTLKVQQQRITSNERVSRSNSSSMVEGLLGILLHFIKNADRQSAGIIKEHHLMTALRDQLSLTPKARAKQLAALGLRHLSKYGLSDFAAADSEDPQPPKGFCFSCHIVSGRWKPRPPVPSPCPIHGACCEDGNELCLFKTDCIKPLANVLSDKDTLVQVAALEALSTLLVDNSNGGVKRAVVELERLGIVDAVVSLFTESRPGELQEKAVGMVDKFLRVEICAQRYSLNQSLVRALVEAFKHGSRVTKSHAQDALTNLKQISGASNSSHSRGQR